MGYTYICILQVYVNMNLVMLLWNFISYIVYIYCTDVVLYRKYMLSEFSVFFNFPLDAWNPRQHWLTNCQVNSNICPLRVCSSVPQIPVFKLLCLPMNNITFMKMCRENSSKRLQVYVRKMLWLIVLSLIPKAII